MVEKQNILFIIIDQLRADCVTGALEAYVDMPNIRALRDDSVSFNKHYSVVNPCGPARASILTSQYAYNHGSVRNGAPLAFDTPNLAREIRKAGYEPMLFGYTDTSGDPSVLHENDPSVREYESVMPGWVEKLEMRAESSYPWRASLKTKGYDIPPFDEFFVPQTPKGQEPRLDDPAFYKAEDSDTAFLTDEVLKELSVRQGRGWFAHVTYLRPHPPLVAAAPYNHMYKDADIPPPIADKTCQEEAATHPYLAIYLEVMKHHKYFEGPLGEPDVCDGQDPEIIKIGRAIYMGLVTEVDHHVGRIIDHLKSTNEYDNTLIVLTADHGEMLGDHRSWEKRSVYEASFHVPLIIRDPNNKKFHGTVIERFSESIDIMPTILRWAGLGDGLIKPNSYNGHCLMAFLKGGVPGNWRTHVYAELDFGEPADPTPWQQVMGLDLQDANLAILRDENYKLVHFNAGIPPLLFDLKADPNEMVDLADDAESMPILLKMTQKLLSHRMRYTNRRLSNYRVTPQGTLSD
ncbi:MAG: phosphonate monoester hydrolase [Hyphomicrobiales bacterium]|nr:MAG: phosphonate monoester hydrolase [Hyphomicrobiales bacterium]